MSLGLILQIGLNGLVLGTLYGLAALGLTLIFGIMRIIQFAHGEVAMLGAFFLYYWYASWGMPYWVGLLLTPLVIFLFGILLQRLFFRPVMGPDMLPSLAVSLALIFILENTGNMIFGAFPKGIPSVISGVLTIGGVALPYERLTILAMSSLVVWGFFMFLKRTRTGLAMSAVAENRDSAALMGINTGRIDYLAFGLGSALAGFAGALLGSLLLVSPSMGFGISLKAFLVVILGGLGSVPGAVLGGFIVGLIDSFVSTALGSELATMIIFGVVFLIIVFKPLGLFSREW